jgi:hypothetical protein
VRFVNVLWGFAFLGLTFVARPSDACDQAQYARLLPLGRADVEVVALELKQFRRPEDASWLISARLIGLAETGGVLRFVRSIEPFPVIDTRDGKKTYLDAVRPTLLKALERARKLPRFKEATVLEQWDCDYARRCGRYRLGQKGERLELSAGRGKSAVRTAVPTHGSGSEAPSLESWRLAAVMIVEIAGEPFALVSMSSGSLEYSVCGRGDKRCVANRRPSKRKNDPSILKSLVVQAPLWHGDDFDFLMRLHANGKRQ